MGKTHGSDWASETQVTNKDLVGLSIFASHEKPSNHAAGRDKQSFEGKIPELPQRDLAAVGTAQSVEQVAGGHALAAEIAGALVSVRKQICLVVGDFFIVGSRRRRDGRGGGIEACSAWEYIALDYACALPQSCNRVTPDKRAPLDPTV